jgi:uncharacterized membrane protein YeaQ/YmgE (transglycosylase-associated protein family)
MGTILTILGYLALGAVVGPLARLLVPGREAMSITVTILIGALGSFLGGLVAREILGWDTAGIDWIASILGTVVLVLLYRAVAPQRHSRANPDI